MCCPMLQTERILFNMLYAGYPDWLFSWLSSVSQGEIFDSKLEIIHETSFSHRHNSLLIIHNNPFFRHSIAYAVDNGVKEVKNSVSMIKSREMRGTCRTRIGEATSTVAADRILMLSRAGPTTKVEGAEMQTNTRKGTGYVDRGSL
jgi:hypothetical protein